jgi:hypothetical protein
MPKTDDLSLSVCGGCAEKCKVEFEDGLPVGRTVLHVAKSACRPSLWFNLRPRAHDGSCHIPDEHVRSLHSSPSACENNNDSKEYTQRFTLVHRDSHVLTTKSLNHATAVARCENIRLLMIRFQLNICNMTPNGPWAQFLR